MYFAPTGDNKITKVTFETSVTNINAIGTNISTIEAKVGSTYNFSIDSVTSSTQSILHNHHLTGGQDAIDNSIHSGSEITLAGNIITFKPTQARTLFYHSGSHESMGGVINVTAPPAAAGSGGSSSGGASGSALTSTDVNITAEQFADVTQCGNGWLTYIPPSPKFALYSSLSNQAYHIASGNVDFGNNNNNNRLGKYYSAFGVGYYSNSSDGRNCAVYYGDYAYVYMNQSQPVPINRINLKTSEIKCYTFDFDETETHDSTELNKYMCSYIYYLSIDQVTGNLYVSFSPQSFYGQPALVD